ncbi:DUF2244 domain-containing protein, partial [Burkholderia pseudomallei]|nr:DUF2244 domain-containing protein [Burkholderia pseudomallei]
LAALTLAIAMPFAIAGAWAVFACAIGEIAAMCGCFLLYARHAVDYDCVALTEQRLEVVQCDGAQLRRYDWNPLWVAVDLDAAHARDPTIRIRHGSETVLVGRHVTLARRRHVAGELNAALAASAGDFGDTDFAPSVRQRQPEPLAAHR